MREYMTIKKAVSKIKNNSKTIRRENFYIKGTQGIPKPSLFWDGEILRWKDIGEHEAHLDYIDYTSKDWFVNDAKDGKK